MNRKLLIFIAILAASLASCGEAEAEDKTLAYQDCLKDFFSGNPLGNCGSFATSDSEERETKVFFSEDKLMVEIEIDECMNQLELYHSWLAAEIQTSCFKGDASTISFTDGASKEFFVFKKESLPSYFSEKNKDLYLDRTITKPDASALKSILFDAAMPSEVSYYVLRDEAGTVHVNMIRYMQEGNEQQYADFIEELVRISNQFDNKAFEERVVFHVMEQYGRVVVSL